MWKKLQEDDKNVTKQPARTLRSTKELAEYKDVTTIEATRIT